MKLESFIAGTIIGAMFSDPNNQRLLMSLTQKTASYMVDSLNKRGGVNAPTNELPKEAEPQSEA